MYQQMLGLGCTPSPIYIVNKSEHIYYLRCDWIMKRIQYNYSPKRIIDTFDPKDFRCDPEYRADREYAGFAIKRDDVVNTERFKLKIKRRRVF